MRLVNGLISILIGTTLLPILAEETELIGWSVTETHKQTHKQTYEEYFNMRRRIEKQCGM